MYKRAMNTNLDSMWIWFMPLDCIFHGLSNDTKNSYIHLKTINFEQKITHFDIALIFEYQKRLFGFYFEYTIRIVPNCTGYLPSSTA